MDDKRGGIYHNGRRYYYINMVMGNLRKDVDEDVTKSEARWILDEMRISNTDIPMQFRGKTSYGTKYDGDEVDAKIYARPEAVRDLLWKIRRQEAEAAAFAIRQENERRKTERQRRREEETRNLEYERNKRERKEWEKNERKRMEERIRREEELARSRSEMPGAYMDLASDELLKNDGVY